VAILAGMNWVRREVGRERLDEAACCRGRLVPGLVP
jgi:hypothetical protein